MKKFSVKTEKGLTEKELPCYSKRRRGGGACDLL
jgi:hypothetical protein